MFTEGGQIGRGLWQVSVCDPVSAVIGGGSLISGVLGATSSSGASKQAASSANQAAQLQQQQYATTRADLLPYNQVGQSAANQLEALNTSGFNAGQPNYLDMAAQNVPGTMTQAALEATPGYQFQLSQGLQSTQNAAAARGLGVSGAALKGAATYATGLADSNYQTQFTNQQTKYQDYLNLNTGQQSNATNLYSRLSGTSTLGANAAASTGTQGTAAASTGGNYLNQAGQDTAAGTKGISNAFIGSANSGMQNYLAYTGLQNGMTGGYGTAAAQQAAGLAGATPL